MKSKLFLTTVIIFIATTLFAQRSDSRGERWDTDNVQTISGTITSVNHPIAVIKSDNGTEYQIHMGPYWFWNQNNYKLLVDVSATIKGEVKTKNNSNDIYPWDITQNGTTMKFADEKEVPNWSGGNVRGKGKGNCFRNGNGWGRGNNCNGWGRGNCPRKNK